MKRSHGFTLIELMVAIGVMALIALLSWRGLDGMARSQEATRARANAQMALQTALAQWGTDLDAVMTLPNTTPIDWDGQVLRITRANSARPDPGALVVAWTRRGAGGVQQWLRWQSPPLRSRAEWSQAWEMAAQWARNPGEAERRGEVALLPLADWRLYYYRGGTWSNPQSSSTTNTATGAVTVAVPDGIRLELALPGGNITRDWFNAVAGSNPQ
ncbi:MAG: prepilin-type N-terminal cleavage/methylation domain-containing protein [Acidovorax sp.]